MSAGINAALSGAMALQVQLGELNDTMLGAPLCASSARTQLAAALPNWRTLAARLQQVADAAQDAANASRSGPKAPMPSA